MDVLTVRDRASYLQTQIERSDRKFVYCKVSSHDALKYRRMLAHAADEAGERLAAGPICCLGTRNGREVDLFRAAFFGPRLLRRLVAWAERETHSFVSLVPWLEGLGRSDWRALSARSVVGVEVNPRAARRDVWVGSFDEMPAAWTGQFGLLYSNSFDQAQDPLRTAREWTRIVRPGGHLIIAFTKHRRPTETDPVGGLCFEELRDLFGGDVVYYAEQGSENGYSELILRMPEAPGPRGGER